jgi:hypothetical protein
MIHMTLRQAKMYAKKVGTAFSCYIDAPNGFYGLSTVFMFHDRVCIYAPHLWERPFIKEAK